MRDDIFNSFLDTLIYSGYKSCVKIDQSQLFEEIVSLQIKVTHQEKLIEELNEALYLQQQRLDFFEKEMKDFKKLIQDGPQEIRPNEKPPHY